MTTPSNSVSNRIKPISEKSPFVKVLVYGDPGVGKTVFAATAPKNLIVDVEHGTRSLLNHPELTDVLVLEIRTWDEMMELLTMVQNKEGVFGEIETITIDSISELQRRVMDDQLRRKGSNLGSEAYIPEGKDYQENTERMRRFAMFLRDLPINFILTCHSKTQEDEATKITYLRPDLTPKFTSTLMGQMDVVGYMRLHRTKQVDENDVEREIVRRVLQVHPTTVVQAKSRFNLPPYLVNPVFADLLKPYDFEENN